MFVMTLVVFMPAARAQNKILFDAMKDELARSMNELKLENAPAPYYISYMVNDSYNLRIGADSGAIVINSESHGRLLRVDVHVGDYARDNYNFRPGGNQPAHPRGIPLNIDDDYDALRRQIWQETDHAYKTAVDTLNRKTAALRDVAPTDRPADFSKGGATASVVKANDFDVSREMWAERVNSITGMLPRDRNIERSIIDLQIRVANTLYVNSEGAETLDPSSITRLTIILSGRAEDGSPVENYRVYTTARAEELPDLKTLETDIQALATGFNAMRTAPIGEEYSGPVLFEGEAAGELFAQGFVNFLKGIRTPETDVPQLTALLNQSANPFINRINTKVAANFLSIKAVPSMKRYGQKELAGAYATDSEGFPARDVSLVENGILKTLLMSRAPIKGIDVSNGHGRGTTVIPSVIHVISENKKPYDQLKQNLIDAVRDEGLAYGYIICGLIPSDIAASSAIQTLLGQRQSDPGQFRLSKPYSIFRLYADGREEQVRGLEIGVVNANALRNVLAASEDETAHIYPAGGAGNAATIITPSLLINGIDLKKSAIIYPKPPVVDSPIRD